MRPELARAILATAFHVALGLAIGLFLAALGRAYFRLSAGGLARDALIEFLTIIVVALSTWWLAAALHTRAVRDAPPDRLVARPNRRITVTPPMK